MPGPAHLDFDVLFSRDGDGFRAQVLRSPAGEGRSAASSWPFADRELEKFVLGPDTFRARTRPADLPLVAAARRVGGELFGCVFAKEKRMPAPQSGPRRLRAGAAADPVPDF